MALKYLNSARYMCKGIISKNVNVKIKKVLDDNIFARLLKVTAGYDVCCLSSSSRQRYFHE